MGCFLSCVYQPDAPQYAITTRVKKSMADTTCHTRNRCVITIHHAAGKSNFQQNLRQQGSCTTKRAFCQNIYCLLESTQVLEHTHNCNGIISPPPTHPPPPVWYYYKRYNTHIDKRWNFSQNFIHQGSLITNYASKLFAWKFSSPDTFFSASPPPKKTLPFSEEEHHTLFANASLSYLAVVFCLCSFWILIQ